MIFCNKQVFVPGKPFKPSLMFVGKTGTYPSETHLVCSTLGQAAGLIHKNYSRLEKLAKDKHSSLLRKFINYGENIL